MVLDTNPPRIFGHRKGYFGGTQKDDGVYWNACGHVSDSMPCPLGSLIRWKRHFNLFYRRIQRTKRQLRGGLAASRSRQARNPRRCRDTLFARQRKLPRSAVKPNMQCCSKIEETFPHEQGDMRIRALALVVGLLALSPVLACTVPAPRPLMSAPDGTRWPTYAQSDYAFVGKVSGYSQIPGHIAFSIEVTSSWTPRVKVGESVVVPILKFDYRHCGRSNPVASFDFTRFPVGTSVRMVSSRLQVFVHQVGAEFNVVDVRAP